MPNIDDMKDLFRIELSDGKGALMTSDLNGVNITIEGDPYFEDFARIGAFLSLPDHRPAIIEALRGLEDAMVEEIRGVWIFSDKKSSAIEYFESKTAALNDKKAPKRDSDFQKLLTKSLSKFERAHSFVVPDKPPVFAGFVFGNVFKETVKARMHFKDVGAGARHGEYTHRIQWYVLTKAGALTSVNPSDAGHVYGGIHRWLNKRRSDRQQLIQLWNYMFDMAADAVDETDFRSPERFNDWLTGPADENVCPLLRGFLRSRRTKRQEYNMGEYLIKKLGRADAENAMQVLMTGPLEKKNPSGRVVYDGKAGAFEPYARK